MDKEIIKVENESVEAFMQNLIDYAGLFPPAQLPLDASIRNYVSFKKSKDSWMLGTFIIPVSRLAELDSQLDLIHSDTILPLSVTGMKCSDYTECQNGLRNDLKKIAIFREKHGQTISIEAMELPLPLSVPKVEDLARLSEMIKNENLKLFCEVTIVEEANWEQQLQDTLEVFAAHNTAIGKPLGVKLRTGGLDANMFPAPEKVAAFISSCAKHHLPLKFTAGLHHPIRMYRDEVQTKMHGFLNVFTAGFLAYAYPLDRDRLAEILSDEDPEHFKFNDQELSWKNLSVCAKDMREIRKWLYSYGSCSFDEPRDEMRELKFLREVSE